VAGPTLQWPPQALAHAGHRPRRAPAHAGNGAPARPPACQPRRRGRPSRRAL